MLSQTGKYAIRAMVILAGRESTAPFDAAQISSQLSLPANYLAKILQVLARAGLLNSTRGIHGGYSLARPPDQITLLSIVEPFENALKRQACLMGRAECGRDVSCLMHSRWHPVVQAYEDFLKGSTLADLVAGAQNAVHADQR